MENEILKHRQAVLGNIHKGFEEDDIDIEKGGKRALVGEIRNWNGKNYRKIAEGKWLEVSEQGLTRREHWRQRELENIAAERYFKQGNRKETDLAFERQMKHQEAAFKLSNEEVDLDSIDKKRIKNDKNNHSKTSGEQEVYDIRKADIFNTLKQEENSIRITKTGKQIKQQIDTVVLPELRVKLSALKLKADEKLKDCGERPTKDVYPWWAEGIQIDDCGYKIYDWEETCILNKESIVGVTISSEDVKNKYINVPQTEEEAKARREYNNIIQEICNILVDLKACEILKQIDDNKTYELTPLQVIAFKF